MPNDADLLGRYAGDGSEEAFSELVGRHLDLVYSAAFRHANGDAALAEDITQCVFAELARKASRLSHHPMLVGWLYTCVHHLAANLRRAERRRHERERAACAMNDLQDVDGGEGLWHQIGPILDDAMHDLSAKDRMAIILRFFKGQSLREVGNSLGLKENSARMRVDRALEKLRGLLVRRGVSSTIPALSAALVAGAVLSAPTGLAATVSAGALAQASVSAATTNVVFWQIMNAMKVKVGLAAVLVTAGVGMPVWQHVRMKSLRAENLALQAQLAELSTLRSQLRQVPESPDSAEVERLQESEQQLKRQVAQLRNQLSMVLARPAPRPPAAAALPAQSAPGTNVVSPAISAAMNLAMERALEQQTVAKVPRLTQRLHLSPEQEDAVREIMLRRMKLAREMAQRTLAGNLTREDLEQKEAMQSSVDEEIKALLTPDQRVAYDDYKREEVHGQARLVANAELLQMQGVLGLDDEQQDAVFTALYDHTVERMNGELNDSKPQTEDRAAVERWVMEERLKALEPVLSPEQLEQYRQIQERRAELTERILQPQESSVPQ